MGEGRGYQVTVTAVCQESFGRVLTRASAESEKNDLKTGALETLTETAAEFELCAPAMKTFLKYGIVALFCLGAASGKAAVPRYETAWQFARTLQEEYAKDRSSALKNYTDSDLMFQRTLQVLGDEFLRSARAKEAWEKFYWPAVQQDFDALATYETMFADQMALVDGQRVLQCVLQRADGFFMTLALWLDERPDGRVVIVDYRTMAQALEATRRMRALVVYSSGLFLTTLDDDERSLALESSSFFITKQAITDASHGQPKQALERLDRLPVRVKGTLLWRDLRDSIAFQGYEPALQSALRGDNPGHSLNPVLALADATNRRDAPARIAAFQHLADYTFNSPFVRALQAGALLEANRPEQALALARDTYRLNPFSPHACSVATRAAARLENVGEAMAALRVWSRLAKPQAIDEDLAREESLASLRQRAEYRDWLASTPDPTDSPAP